MPTIPQIKESLDGLGVAYQPRAKKAELLLLLRRAQGGPDSPPEPDSPPPRRAITRAHAEVIAQRAMLDARDKVAELPVEDRGAVTGALDTLEQSAEQALVDGALVDEVQRDLSGVIEHAVQSIDDALGLSDEEERQDALAETASALDATAQLVETSGIAVPSPDGSVSGDDTFASAASALQFEQAWSDDSDEEAAAPRAPPAVPARPPSASASQTWFGSDDGSSSDSDGELGGTDSDDEDTDSDTASEASDAGDVSSASTALRRGLTQRRTAGIRSVSADERSERRDAQEEAVERAAERRAAEKQRRETAASDARAELRARYQSAFQEHAVRPVGESSVGPPGASSIASAAESPSLNVSARTPTRSPLAPTWSSVSDISAGAAPTPSGLVTDISTASSPSVAFNLQTSASQLGDIDAILAEVADEVAAALPNASVAELSAALVKEVTLREDMSMVRERLTDPAQAQAFANATRQTPRLLKLITQGVYTPTAFTGTTGKQAAMRIEQQLAYAEGAKTSGARRAAGPIVARERPTAANPGIKRWRRPRFTTAAS